MTSVQMNSARICDLADVAGPGHDQAGHMSSAGLRIALLTPYDGGNLGDAAIQDAMIANLRHRLPEARFSGISLNCRNFLERHGSDAFPLCVTGRPFYAMSSKDVAAAGNQNTVPDNECRPRADLVKRVLHHTPGLVKLFKKLRGWMLVIPNEFLHFVRGYRFVGHQDLLIVSGGGQLDEEWGGPWGHPFALFKWALLARVARVSCAFASVGTGKIRSPVSRLLFSMALRLACYRSYRDGNSRGIAASLFKAATNDPVVPDLAFNLPVSEVSAGTDVRSLAGDRTVVAISPIAYGKRGSWPSQDHGVHDGYLQQMAQVLSRLVERGYFLVIVWSSLGDDESVVPELLKRLDCRSKENLSQHVHVPAIKSWKDIVATLRQADVLVASRLHSTLLGLVTHTPTVAVSFDPKVDWLMGDIGLTDCLLQIRNFTAGDVLKAIDHVQSRRAAIVDQIQSFQDRIQPGAKRQFDALASLTTARRGIQFEQAHEH